jgi:eukaryotic-like serine/threonine-protein kinase
LIEKYGIIKSISVGIMGETFIANNLEQGENVLIKKIKLDEVTGSPHLQKYLKNEFKLLNMLNEYPIFPKAIELIEEKDAIYTILEYINGNNLKQILNAKKSLSLPSCLYLGKHLLIALSILHKLGILHRDLKPENIMISQTGQIFLIDFGIAKHANNEIKQDSEQINISDLFITHTNPMGTPMYMAPEQFHETSVGPSADLYSLGVVLYECLTGQFPFKGQNLRSLISEKEELIINSEG